MAACQKCDKKITCDEAAVYKKLVNRGAEKYLCAACLAVHFKCSEELIREKIQQFKDMGCTLFAPE